MLNRAICIGRVSGGVHLFISWSLVIFVRMNTTLTLPRQPIRKWTQSVWDILTARQTKTVSELTLKPAFGRHDLRKGGVMTATFPNGGTIASARGVLWITVDGEDITLKRGEVWEAPAGASCVAEGLTDCEIEIVQ
jgi:hypothetical protein